MVRYSKKLSFGGILAGMGKHKQPNTILRYERELRGWSQQRVADLIGTSVEVVSRWERGERKPGRYFQEKLCQLFGKNAAELGLMGVPAVLQGEIMQSDAEDTSFAHNTSRQEHHILPQQPQVLFHRLSDSQEEHPSQEGFTSEYEMKRREAMKIIGAVGVSSLLTQEVFQPETWERLAHTFTRKSSHIDQTLVNGLKKTVESYWLLRFLGSVTFPDLLQCAVGHLHLVLQLLQSSSSLSTSISLHTLASETAQMVGVLLFDMGYSDAARSCYRFSLHLADEVQNDSLAAAALGRLSIVSAAQNAYTQTLPLLQLAQQLALQPKAYTLATWLFAEEAELHAHLVEQGKERPKACEQALEQVEQTLSWIHGEEDVYGIRFNRARLFAYKGNCYISLQKSELALQSLRAGFDSPESPALFKRLILTDMAKAAIRVGDIEQACSYLVQALEQAAHLQSSGVLEAINSLRVQLHPWESVQAVRDVDERLKSFTSLQK